MKKLLVLLLALAMALTMLASCSSCNDEGDDPSKVSTSDNGNGNNTPTYEGFEEVSQTLYVNSEGGLNVRSAPNADDDSNKIGTLAYGVAVTVTGVNTETGWSRIIYSDDIAYVKSDYLSAEEPNTNTGENAEVIADNLFTECNEKVYVYATGGNDDAHLPDADVRAYVRPYAADWSSQKNDYSLANYTELTRIGVYYNDASDVTVGWSKLTYHDEVQDKDVTIYIRNSQLVTELPADVTPNETPAT